MSGRRKMSALPCFMLLVILSPLASTFDLNPLTEVLDVLRCSTGVSKMVTTCYQNFEKDVAEYGEKCCVVAKFTECLEETGDKFCGSSIGSVVGTMVKFSVTNCDEITTTSLECLFMYNMYWFLGVGITLAILLGVTIVFYCCKCLIGLCRCIFCCNRKVQKGGIGVYIVGRQSGHEPLICHMEGNHHI